MHQGWEMPLLDLDSLEHQETFLFIYCKNDKGNDGGLDDFTHSIILAPLTAMEWQLLSGIALGKTLGTLCRNFTTKQSDVLVALASCVRKGYITQYYLNII